MHTIKNILTHFVAALALGLIILIVLDERNPLMEFLTGAPAKVYMLALVSCCLLRAALDVIPNDAAGEVRTKGRHLK